MFVYPVDLFYPPSTQLDTSLAGEETVCTPVSRDLQGWSDPFHGPPNSPG